MRTREPVKKKRGPPRAYITSIQMLQAFRRDLVDTDFQWALLEREASNIAQVQAHKSVRFERRGPRTFDLVTDEHYVDMLVNDPAWAGLGFLNYPARFTKKMTRLAALRAQAGRPSLVLASAGVGDVWFDQYVWGRADLFFTRPRGRFEGYSYGHFLDHVVCRYPFRGPRAEAYIYDWRTGETRGMVPATPKVK